MIKYIIRICYSKCVSSTLWTIEDKEVDNPDTIPNNNKIIIIIIENKSENI